MIYRGIEINEDAEYIDEDKEVIDTILEGGYFQDGDIISIEYVVDSEGEYMIITSKSEGAKKYQFIGDRLYDFRTI